MSMRHAGHTSIHHGNVVLSIGPEPHPVYPSISAIGGGPPFQPNCVHVLMPFVERLATEEQKRRGVISPDLLNRSPGELQRECREESREPTSTKSA